VVVQVTKTQNILCLMIFHSTKMKNDLVFGFSTWKQLENTLLSVIHVLTYTSTKFITNFCSSDTMMVQVTKTHIILCLMIFHSTKSKMIWYLDSAHENRWKTLSFSNSRAHTDQKLIYNHTMMVKVTKTHIILCLIVFHSIKMKNELIFGFSTWK